MHKSAHKDKAQKCADNSPWRNMVFVGRKNELSALQLAYASKKSELAVVYGRRRIGKSSLIKEFARQKPRFYSFEGIEGQGGAKQIAHFTDMLQQQLDDTLLQSIHFKNWNAVFSYLTEKITVAAKDSSKCIILFDEIQWMAAGRSSMISLIKYYWDNYWASQNVMLVLCGSIASFMVKKVVQSKALYGRITCEIALKGLLPCHARALFAGKRSKEEVLKYLLVFGTVPYYLELVKQNRSFDWNMNAMLFSPHSPMKNEIDRIFYNQFRETAYYNEIVKFLATGLKSFNQIGKKLKLASGGGLKRYLDILEKADIIRSFIPVDKKQSAKLKKYGLSDELLRFHFKYIDSNARLINEAASSQLFETLTADSFGVWLGFAFERFCIKHAYYLARVMGFDKKVLLAAPYFQKGDNAFQIDCIFLRSDKVYTVCEIKYSNKPVTTAVIPEVKRKLELLPVPRSYSVETALISLYGPDKALSDAQFFDYAVTLDDILPG
jgi:AAA+ ATPase superfamily predicted ATPase